MNKIYVIAIALFSLGCASLKKNKSSDAATSSVDQQTLQKMATAVSVEPEEEKKPSYVPPKAPYQPSDDKVFQLIDTKLEVSFDWENQFMIGEAVVSARPYFYSQNKIELDAQGFDKLSVKQILNNGESKVLKFDYSDSTKLKIELDKAYTRQDTVVLKISYIAKPNQLKNKGGTAISEDKGLYFINPLGKEKNKPKQIWTQGEPEASSCWFPTIDNPNQKTTQEINITVDTAYVSLSNGALQYSIDNGDGTRTDCWVQEKPHAPYLFMMAVGEFAKVEDSWNDIEVDYYVEKEYEPYAKAIFGNTPEMMTFFSEKLNYPFPWDKYSQIVVRDYVSGAMENTSASIFMEQVQLTDRELLDKDWDYIIAHELFHHWFGDLVTCESWSNLALNESFANYSEYLWFEHKYGSHRADAHRMEEIEGYLRQASRVQYPIIRYHYEIPLNMFDSHSYNKGGLVLHMLRQYLGDEAFFASLSRYLHHNEYTDAEIHELRLAFEDETGLDLQWFFDQWFMSAGHPSLVVNKTYKEGVLAIEVKQMQDTLYTPMYRLPLQVGVWNDGKEVLYDIEVTKAQQTIEIPLEVKPEAVVFDAKRQLLAEIQENYSLEERIKLFNWSSKYQDKYDALDELTTQVATQNYLEKQGRADTTFTATNKQQIKEVIFEALEEQYYELRVQAIEALYAFDYVENTKEKILDLAINDKKSLVRAEAIKFLAQHENNPREEVKHAYQLGLKDSSYAVLASSLSAMARAGMDVDVKIIEEYKGIEKLEVAKGVAEYYIALKDTTNYDWFLSRYSSLGAIDKIGFAELLGTYLMNQNNDQKEKSIAVLKNVGLNDKQVYARFSAYKSLFFMNEYPNAQTVRLNLIEAEKDPMLKNAYARWESKLKKD